MVQLTVRQVVAIGSRTVANARVHVDQRHEPPPVRRNRRAGPGNRFPEERIRVVAVARSASAADCGQPTPTGKARDTAAPDASTGGPQSGMTERRTATSTAFRTRAAKIFDKGAVLDAALALRPLAPRDRDAETDTE
jgi:hypothetical protein